MNSGSNGASRAVNVSCMKCAADTASTRPNWALRVCCEDCIAGFHFILQEHHSILRGHFRLDSSARGLQAHRGMVCMLLQSIGKGKDRYAPRKSASTRNWPFASISPSPISQGGPDEGIRLVQMVGRLLLLPGFWRSVALDLLRRFCSRKRPVPPPSRILYRRGSPGEWHGLCVVNVLKTESQSQEEENCHE